MPRISAFVLTAAFLSSLIQPTTAFAQLCFEFPTIEFRNSRGDLISPPAVIAENQEFSMEVYALPPLSRSAAVERLTMSSAPSGSQMLVQFTQNGAIGSFTWRPTFEQANTYNISFRATLTSGCSTTETFTITVNNVDRAPIVNAPPTISVTAGQLLTFDVGARDPDGQVITALNGWGLPFDAIPSASFTPVSEDSGTFSWTPGFDYAGSFDVHFDAGNALIGTKVTKVTVHSALTTGTVTTTAAGRFSGVAFPLKQANNTVGGILIPQLGQPNESRWRLGHFDPELNDYVSAEGGSLANIERGLGYWLVTKESEEIFNSGLADSIGSLDMDLTVGLSASAPGWYQLGNPFLLELPVSSISVGNPSPSLPLNDPTNTRTARRIWVWNSAEGRYDSTSTSIRPFEAFWVKKVSATDVMLRMLRPTKPSPVMIADDPTPRARWDVRIDLSQGTRFAHPLMLGVADVDPKVWHSMDEPLPPSPPGAFLRAVVKKDRWGSLNGEYASEYKPEDTINEWDFAISGGVAPGQIELRCTARGLPARARLSLTDLESGNTWSIRPEMALLLAATAGSSTYRLTVRTDGPERSPSTPVTFRAYPNPSRSATGFVFRLARASVVRADIVDVAGRLVRTLETQGGVGENVLLWDGRDRAGRSVGAGLYLARCRTSEDEAMIRVIRLD
jgi:Bacterial Ig domain